MCSFNTMSNDAVDKKASVTWMPVVESPTPRPTLPTLALNLGSEYLV